MFCCAIRLAAHLVLACGVPHGWALSAVNCGMYWALELDCSNGAATIMEVLRMVNCVIQLQQAAPGVPHPQTCAEQTLTTTPTGKKLGTQDRYHSQEGGGVNVTRTSIYLTPAQGSAAPW